MKDDDSKNTIEKIDKNIQEDPKNVKLTHKEDGSTPDNIRPLSNNEYESSDSSSELIDNLLHKCKVTNLPNVYMKYLKNNNGICTLEQLISFDGYFTRDNILNDLIKVRDIILLKVYPEILHRFFIKPSLLKKKRTINGFQYIDLIVNSHGLAKIMQFYKRDKYLNKKITLNEIHALFQIQENSKQKFNGMLQNIIKSRSIFATVQKNSNGKHVINLTGKFKHPSNKALVNQIAFLSILLILILIILIWIARPFLF